MIACSSEKENILGGFRDSDVCLICGIFRKNYLRSAGWDHSVNKSSKDVQITKQTEPKDAGQTLLPDTEQRKIYFSFSVPRKIFGLQMKHEDLTSCSDSRDYPVHEFRLGAAPPARLERKSLPVLRSCRHVCLPVPPPALPLCVLLWEFCFSCSSVAP